MARIKGDVSGGHLSQFPTEVDVLRPFLNGFDVTWAKRRRAYNTELSVYFLNPEKSIREQFGLDSEVMLVVSDYPTMQPRTIQAVEQFLQDLPAKGRVDQAFFFVITKDNSAIEWLDDYTSRNPQSRIPVAFTWEKLKKNAADQWFVRNEISKQLFSRDLFDYQLPLDNDLFFFGRDSVVAEFVDAIKRSQNRGLFGLRKTGKTSVLYKIRRISDESNSIVLYYDCKNPAIRSLKWAELLSRISKDILKKTGKKLGKAADQLHPSDRFSQVIQSISKKQNVCLIFDEIEYISPIAKIDTHWHSDFLEFWQTMWTVQSEERHLSFIIAGVNPSVVEMDSVNGVQNPMFGIVRPTFLKGFEKNELRGMLRYFGRRMGLKFSDESLDYLLERYGGHPLLTRMACSYVNSAYDPTNFHRPLDVEAESLSQTQEEREAELVFYCRHVVSELKEFYPDEYLLLEMISSGNVAEFKEFSELPGYTQHLKDYGLVGADDVSRPYVKIPVISKFVANDLSKSKGLKIGRYVIGQSLRDNWLRRRVNSITRDLRLFARIISEANLLHLYGVNGFPEAERFCSLKPVCSLEEFESFINICSRSFVEPIQNYGKKIGNKDYYWIDIKLAYPDYWVALQRIKAYRNDNMHIELNNPAEAELKKFLGIDFSGKNISQVDEPYFMLQQAVIDELFLAVQCELDRYS